MGQFNYNDYYNLALYVNTTATNNDYMSFRDGVLLNGVIGGGIEVIKYGGGAVKNIFSKKNAIEAAKLKARNTAALKSLKGESAWQTWRNSAKYNTIKSFESKVPTYKAVTKTVFKKLSPKAQAAYLKKKAVSNYYVKARRLLSEAKKLRGAEQAKKIKEFEKAFAEAKLAAYKAKYTGNLKPKTRLGKAKNFAKTYTGVKKLNTGYKTLLANSSKFRVLTKFVKGNALFAGISVLADYDKFQKTKEKCGTKAMGKEIGKSVAVAATESVGFLAGAKLGAALGTTIGTACPVVGNIVGGIAGALIGGLISWGAGKLMHKAMGKSELEKYKIEQADLRASNAEFNSVTRKRIVSEAMVKIKDDKNTDPKKAGQQMQIPVSKEEIAKAEKSIENVLSEEPVLMQEIENDIAEAERLAKEAAKQNKTTQSTQTAQTQQESAGAEQTTEQNETTLPAQTQQEAAEAAQITEQNETTQTTEQTTQAELMETPAEDPLQKAAEMFISRINSL